MTEETARIKDQLGKNPEVFPTLNADYNETLTLEEGPTKGSTNYIGHSLILGHATNGKLGVVNLGVDGIQIVLGAAARVEATVFVVNPNQFYRERFYFTLFQDSLATNTANWNTTLGRLEMHSSSNHMTVYNTVAQSDRVAFNDGTITSVTVNAIETKYGGDSIQYFISADAGVNWIEVSLSTSTSVHTSGVDMRFKIIFVGSGGSDTYIRNLRINYG